MPQEAACRRSIRRRRRRQARLGLSRVLPADELMVVANTADDFEHLGLSISPDIDTPMYVAVSTTSNAAGAGATRPDVHRRLPRSAATPVFKLGDGDLATHIERTRRLAAGESGACRQSPPTLRHRLNIATRIVPMTDDKVRTRLRTAEGWLDFQDYFVRRRCAACCSNWRMTERRPRASIRMCWRHCATLGCAQS